MMQEEELVIKQKIPDAKTQGFQGREVRPFSETFQSEGQNFSTEPSDLANDYKVFYFEVFAACVMTLSTISGGLLEGYTSPAIPSMLKNDTLDDTSQYFVNKNITSQTIYRYDRALNNLEGSNITPLTVDVNSSLPSNFTVNNTIDNSTSILNNSGIESKVDINLSEKNNITDKEDSSNTLNKKTISNLSDTTIIKPQTNLTNVNTTNVNNTEIVDVSNNSKTQINLTEINYNLNNISKTNSTSTNNDTLKLSISSNTTRYNTSTIAPEQLQISEEQASWLGSLLLLGAFFGALGSSYVISFGRRHAVLLSAFPRFIGWLLISMSSTVSALYAGRFLTGVSIGLVTSAAPIYISEVAHPSIRGFLACLVQLGVNIGIFLAALFGTFLSWRELAIFGCVSVVVYFIPCFLIPNSPSWLVLRGRENDARAALKRLRGPKYLVEEELQQIITVTINLSKHRSVTWRDLLSERRTVLPLCVVVLITVVNRFSGYNAIITYCATFVHQIVPAVSEYWSAAAITLLQVLATLVSALLVDRVGRRCLLLSSIALMCASLISIALALIAMPQQKVWNHQLV